MKTKYAIAIAAVVLVSGIFLSLQLARRSPGVGSPPGNGLQAGRGEGVELGSPSDSSRGNVKSALPSRTRSITDPDVHFLTPGLEASSSLDGLLDGPIRSEFNAIMDDFVRQVRDVERANAEVIRNDGESYLKIRPSAESLELVERTAANLRDLPDGPLLAENFLRSGVAPELNLVERHLFLEKVAPKEGSESREGRFELIVEVTDATTGQSLGRSMNIIDVGSEDHGDLARRYSHLIDVVQTANQIDKENAE